MRKTLSLLTLAIGLALGASVQAHGINVNHVQCTIDTEYDVRVDDAGIEFTRDKGQPAEVFMHDGHLRVDHRDLAVSADDAARLRSYEGTVRELLPEIAGIAREGLDIGFSAMTTVAATFAEDGHDRDRLMAKLKRSRAGAMRQIDAGLGSGVWRQHDMGDLMEGGLQDAVSELVGTVTAGAVKAALSGDQTRVAALEARADSLEKTIDKQVNARADQLEVRAQALCPKLATLEQLQQQFQFRLPDGSPLRLVEQDADGHPRASQDKVARR